MGRGSPGRSAMDALGGRGGVVVGASDVAKLDLIRGFQILKILVSPQEDGTGKISATRSLYLSVQFVAHCLLAGSDFS